MVFLIHTELRCTVNHTSDDMICYDIFVNCNWVARVQYTFTHTHTHKYTERYKTNNTKNNTVWKSAGRVPSLRVYPVICPTTEEKARKNLSQGIRRVLAGTMKVHKHTIRIYKHKNSCNYLKALKEMGTAVAQWLRCCVTNRKLAGSIPDGVIGIFH